MKIRAQLIPSNGQPLFVALIAGLGLAFVCFGCKDDPIPFVDQEQVYEGLLHWDTLPAQVGIGDDFDTVQLRIDGSQFNYSHLTNKAGFCDVTGVVSDFFDGTDSANFAQGKIDNSPCDSSRVFGGNFSLTFRRDSLFMGKMVMDSVYPLDLNLFLERQSP